MSKRTYFVGRILRLPLLAAGAGFGTVAYLNSQVNDRIDWVKEKFQNGQKLWLEFKNSSSFDIPQSSSILETIQTQYTKVLAESHDILPLTKKLIHIRHLLKSVSIDNPHLSLPSIVVIGSQSSGKSSVLESIVGHSFLPKGKNMVTRRPIELTLVHTPESDEDYCEFPQLGFGKILDFKKVELTLTDLNLAVSEKECIHETPIELFIYSKNVPDLSLVDLPGYIQIHNKNQPPELKEKILNLCEKYINSNNIILAVSAADVDLANSEALRSSRKYDPDGERTIGVITKMDLVDPSQGVKLLFNQDYPLKLGYVGVVNVPGNPAGLSKSRELFFRQNSVYPPEYVGSQTLLTKLMHILELQMKNSVNQILDAVQADLNETSYQFKVQYNDRRISPESYVAETMDNFKRSFKAFANDLSRTKVKDMIKQMLDNNVIEIASNLYWDHPKLPLLPTECIGSSFWEHQSNVSTGSLTRSGVGKTTVQLITKVLEEKMEGLLRAEPFVFHENAAQRIRSFSNEILKSTFRDSVDQVENTIKPYKYEVECTSSDWIEGRKSAAWLLEAHIQEYENELRDIKATVGRRKLRNAIKLLEKLEKNSSNDYNAQELNLQLDKIQKARELSNHITCLQRRLKVVNSRQCASENRTCCPEVLLSVISEKLAQTAVMFIQIELLNEYFFELPREIDEKMYYSFGKGEILDFARQNPSIRRRIDLQERKAILQKVVSELKALNLD